MELIEIVDEKGNFTGQIMDKDEAHDKNLLHNEVAVFILNDKEQVLLQKRSANKRFHPNKWGLCAGHVDAHESLEDAALREMNEEVGLQVLKEELYPFSERRIVIRNINSHITYFYYVKCNRDSAEFTIQEEELSEVKWFLIDDIIKMIDNKDDSITFSESMKDRFLELKSIKW